MGVETHKDLAQLSFLVGRWEGVGVTDFPGGEEFQFGQLVEFTHDGQPYLDYRSTMWRMEPDGSLGDFVTSESGYWRMRPEEFRTEGEDGAPAPHLEVLITHPEGFTELYYGAILASRVELRTDAVLRSDSSREVTGSHRLYGLIGENRGTLGYAWDLTAEERTFQVSAQLKPTAG